jgi:site-specific recombinase XerD
MATLKRRGTGWELAWTDPDGHRQRKIVGHVGTTSKREAQAILTAKEYELASHSKVLTLPGYEAAYPRFGDYAQEYLRWHGDTYPDSHDRVRQIFVGHLIPHFELMPIDRITAQEARIYRQKRTQAKVKAATTRKELQSLHAALRRAVDWKVLPADPLDGVELPRLLDSRPPHYYSAEQLEQLYRYSIYNGHHAIWKLMANTGLRRSEAVNVRWQDIHDGRLWVESIYEDDERPTARTKSGRWRSIPLNQNARWALQYLKEHVSGASAYVLPRMTKASLSRAFANCATRAELSGSLHSLRHSFISHLVMAGKDLRTVMELAGHSRIEVTIKYSHLAPKHLESAVEALAL